MSAVDDSSNADNEGELVGCFGEEDDEDFWFTDGKSNSPPSPMSSFDFIDSFLTTLGTYQMVLKECQT